MHTIYSIFLAYLFQSVTKHSIKFKKQGIDKSKNTEFSQDDIFVTCVISYDVTPSPWLTP